ncbi:Bacterial transcriptional activator domain protein [Roseovarius albus]|uniref:Bacterial transcriptional activator domain protein n=1 Tax=Roseovarius albus TaxID=1247867 RepID=A0A1X7A452_9RHOB|nr:AAA family ATPase [Roseovarius albus]SLN70002.1 Bacterial transcriptional activator domain protein [Roseovarius albus]
MIETEILDIRVLGGLEIRCGERRLAFPTRHSALLLAVLALSPGGCISREACAALFWGERGEDQARASLRQAIYHTQKVLEAAGAAPLEANRQMIGLEPGCWRSDVRELLDSLEKEPAVAATLYGGELLVGVGRVDAAFEDWVRMESQAISLRLTSVLTPALDVALEAERFEELHGISAALLGLDPLNEKALRNKMSALSGLKRRPAALKAYQNFEATLRQELEIAPEAETIELYESLQAGSQMVPALSKEALPDAGEDRSEFRERRAVSLVLLRPANPINDPEGIALWLETASEKLKGSLQERDAVIMSPVGGSLACVFGARQSVERHSENAALAALQLNAEFDEQARLAVVTGDIIQDVSIPFNAGNTSAIGHLVDEATALVEAVPVGCPMASTGIAARLGWPIEAGNAGIRLKERDLETQTRQALSFVARKTEMTALFEALEASHMGGGRIVGIMGEAGIGKSSLVEAFIAETPNRNVLLEAKARESEQSYSAVTRLFRRWIAPQGNENWENAVSRVVSSGLVEKQDIPALRELLCLPIDDPSWSDAPSGLRRRQIHRLAISTLAEIARESTVILVVEDLHWMDPESLALLDRLVDELTALSLFVIATYRPEFQPNWIGRSFFRLLRMGPLSIEEAQALLSQVASDNSLGDDTREAIIERCGGVPYFLVETARAMKRGEALPASIRDVLSAHVQTLRPRERMVLQCAAILGSEIDASYVGALTTLSEEDIDSAISELRKEELLLRRAGSNAYRFRHALLHDTVYASIPLAERMRLHSAAMDQYLAENPSVRLDLVPAISHHALHAERWKEAVDWCVKAGDRYADLSSYDLASRAYCAATQALERLPANESTIERRVEVSLKQRPVMVPLGHYEEALAELNRAEEVANDIQNPVLSASIEIGKSYLFSTHGRLNEAVTYAQKAAASATQGHQTSVEALLALGQAQSLMGDWKSTIATLEPTLPFWETHPTERFGHTGTRAIWCHGHLAHAYALHADLKQAQDHAEQAFSIATGTGRPLDLIFALHRLGEVYLAKGETDESLSVLEDAIARAKEIDAPIFQVWFACDIVPVYISLGRLTDARTYLSHQNTMANRLKLNQFLAWITLRRAELALLDNNTEQACELTDQALIKSREIPDLALEPAAMIFKAQCLNESDSLRDKAQTLAKKRGLFSLLHKSF